MTMRLVIVGLVLMYPISLFGQNFVEEPFPDMSMFWSALAEKNWPIVVGIGLMFVVWGVRKYFFDVISKKHLPVIILITSSLSSLGMRMTQYVYDGKPWWQGALQGVFEGMMIGFTAMGAWDIKKSSQKKSPMKQFFRNS